MSTKDNMSLIALLQDEDFVNQVINQDDIELLYRLLDQKYPGSEVIIRVAVDIIKSQTVGQHSISDEEINKAWNGYKRKTRKEGRVLRVSFISNFWKAAVLTGLVLTGSAVVYQQFNSSSLKRLADRKSIIENEAVVVLSDGTKHQLGMNEAHVEYSAHGGSVVVKKEDAPVELLQNTKGNNKDGVNQVIVPFGRMHKVTLSDGTLVHLNSGSALVFPAEFKGRIREVYLKGEGYFEVTGNTDRPFIVKTDFIDIRVLGTEFNVSAYPDEQVASAVLVKGTVNVIQKDKLFSNQNFTLVSGQGCFYSVSDQKSMVRELDTEHYVAWKNGMFYFKNQPVLDVVRRLRKYYNQPVQIEGEKLAATLVSGKVILSEDITKVLDYLAKTLEARYEYKNDGQIYILRES